MSRKRRNGSVIAHGREWPLYERWERGVIVLEMSPTDEAEMNRLTKVIQYAWV